MIAMALASILVALDDADRHRMWRGIRAKNRPCDLNAGPQVPMNILKTEQLAANE